MGFKRQARTFRLVWPADHDNHGLEVVMRSLSISELVAFGDKDDVVAAAVSDAPEAQAALDQMLGTFAEKLVSWNLEDDDGQPVPCTFEGVQGQDLDFVMEMVMAWFEAAAGVGRPLPASSSGGETSLAGSIPMEPLSPSRAS